MLDCYAAKDCFKTAMCFFVVGCVGCFCFCFVFLRKANSLFCCHSFLTLVIIACSILFQLPVTDFTEGTRKKLGSVLLTECIVFEI